MRAKSFFGIFLAMAIVPLVLAYLVLQLGWFTPGATAKGEFLKQEISIPHFTGVPSEQSQSHERPQWRIVYQPSMNCEQLCKEQLYGLNQTHSALGKLQKRVKATVLSEQPIDLSEYNHIDLEAVSNSKLSVDYLYVVDPFGKVILRYKGSLDREQTIQTSKFILADLKKLLNYARVG
ncbi:MAG: hypothetical protein HWE10_08210 [Gammaproteobacteria bacterium]|nr:hypothetical protein [Gammaproteobacteria bacterium]